MFVLKSELNKVKFALDWLVENSVKQDPTYSRDNPFKVYSLEKLLYELRRHANLDDHRLKFTSEHMVTEKLNGGAFDFCPNMACQASL